MHATTFPPRTAPASARRWRRWLAGAARFHQVRTVFREQSRRFTVAQVLARAFYAFLLYYAYTQFHDVAGLLRRVPGTPLWPVAWLHWVGYAAGARALLAFYLATNLAGFLTAPWRVGRLLTFLGLFEYIALLNSFGKIGHSQHLLVLVAGVWVLLPDGWAEAASRTRRRCRQETLLVCWLAQAVVLCAYTMSGVGKLAAACYQICLGQANAFSPGSLSTIIAQRLLETHSTSVLGPWIVRHPFLTWPAFPGAMFLETFALLAAFRPVLARPWAAGLILFHVGTFFTMSIAFPPSCFLLALLFFASPFEPVPAPTWQERLSALPFSPKLYKVLQTVRKPRGVLSRDDLHSNKIDQPGE